MDADAAREELLQILTDDSGVIQGAVLFGYSRDKRAPAEIELIAEEGETIHRVSLPPELQGRELGADAFDGYEVVTDKGKAMLRRLDKGDS
ncbi:hypothetical protein R1T08_36525 [Streptomyces sp. SBC-4]|nr:hypothetical protein [Streptomyces sp. SBC-4]MDV5149481.1 hypothetical protein [Streptomyces sp. SBC-4]